MPEITPENFTTIKISQAENVLRPLGWKVVALDKTGPIVKLTITIAEERLETDRKRFNEAS